MSQKAEDFQVQLFEAGDVFKRVDDLQKEQLDVGPGQQTRTHQPQERTRKEERVDPGKDFPHRHRVPDSLLQVD